MTLAIASNTRHLVSEDAVKVIRMHHKAECEFLRGEEFMPMILAIVANPADASAYGVAADFAEERGFTNVASVLRTFFNGPAKLFHGRTYHLTWNPAFVKQWSFAFRHGRHLVQRFSRYGVWATEADAKPNRDSFNWWSMYNLLSFAALVLSEHSIAELGRDNAKRQAVQAKAEIGNPFKVGDLLYDQFGYDETHYHFAEVVAVGKMSVKIRLIGRRGVDDANRTGRQAHRRVEPVAGSFLSDEVKTVVVRVGKNSKGPYAYLPSWSKVTPDSVFSETYYG